MAEIEITLPTVQFGNVKVRATPEELGLHDIDSSYELGVAAAVYVNLFTQGFAKGASVDVTASPTEGLSAPVGASWEAPEEKAQRLLDEGLGGVTEVSDDKPDSDNVPWDREVARKPKPWETENLPPEAVVTSPAMLDAIW